MATIKDGKGTIAIAAFDTDSELKKTEFGRPAPGPNDVDVKIAFCGICHSDVHATNGDWGMNNFPMAPGHEIAGTIQGVGSNVTDFKIGDRVGVGCFVDSCGECGACKRGEQNYCRQHVQTYSTIYPEGKGHDECAGYHTNGGYSTQITVKQDFVYHVPENIELEYVGPLLCAGITMFTPLNQHVLKKGGEGMKVGIAGFGGLGHMGVKLAKAMGAEVVVLSRSTSKRSEAEALGASILAHSDEEAIKAHAESFDVIIDTIPIQHEISHLIPLLKVSGVYHFVGAIPQPVGVSPFALIFSNVSVAGSLVGGIDGTKEMLEFCSKHDIKPEIKVIDAKEAAPHFASLVNGSAPAARHVIDMSTLSSL
jgi:uncharacterized zinc-type alcohol dehydrogenase-like protein